MASIYKPTYTKQDPKTGRRVLVKTRKYYIEYVDSDGLLRRVPGFADKDATQQLAAELERKACREASGLVDRYAEHRARPLAEHLEDFKKFLQSKGNTEKHVEQVFSRVQGCLEGCEFKRIPDIDAQRLSEWLADKREAGLSARSSNFYLSAFKSFCRWLQRFHRMPENPVAHVDGVNPEPDIRHRRRALSDRELGALLAATREAPPRQGLSGQDRAMLYLVASRTGLRASELASLTPESFALEAVTPTVTVKAGYSKHRREDLLPLHPELARQLRAWLRLPRPQGARLWPGGWPRKAAKMLRGDLKRAGITYETPEGFADFHSLRHSYLTALARSGVSLPVIQKLARHCTIALTIDKYSHLELTDTEKAFEALPMPVEKREEPKEDARPAGGEPRA